MYTIDYVLCIQLIINAYYVAFPPKDLGKMSKDMDLHGPNGQCTDKFNVGQTSNLSLPD